ncbi:MAG: 30S ribosomal protein S16 [Gemmatimonadota bacterium]
MSVRIRLRRMGRKKQPYFRVVVTKGDAPRDGAYIEELGFYNPRTRPALLTMDLEKVDSWIGKGAEPTDSAMSLIRKARKGGDKEIRFVAPGEEKPRLKTATRPERRPATSAATAPEGEPAEKTDTLEGAAPSAETEKPAATVGVGETKEAVGDTETEVPESEKAEAGEAEAEKE